MIGWMFIDPVKGKGVVQVYRRSENSGPDRSFKLFGLDPDALYSIEDFDGGIIESSGTSLMKTGFL
jgi:hypothetical protein